MKRTFRIISGTWLAAGLLIAGATVSCTKDRTEPDIPAPGRMTRSQQADLIASLGYDTGDLIKLDDGYLVEGDIWLTDAWLAEAGEWLQTRLTQLGAGQLVSQAYQNKLYMNIYSTNSPNIFWNRPTEEAIDQWNNIDAKCYIDIAKDYSGMRQEISIVFAGKWDFDNSTKTLIKVTPPGFDGKPGRIVINSDHLSLPRFDATNWTDEAYLKKARGLIMHAIGHALGLGHTLTTSTNTDLDSEWGTQISGTTSYDNASIMRRETNPLSWSGFSAADRKDIPIAFPVPDLEPGSIEAKKTIRQIGGTFSIYSRADASGGDKITYRWEKKTGDRWVALDGQTDKDLVGAPVPQELTSEYRRQAANEFATDYSNVCTVTNEMYLPLTAGRIEEEVVVDIASPDASFSIASLEAARCPRSAVTYLWEKSSGNGWTAIPDSNTASFTGAVPAVFRTIYRRTASCAHESSCSNECVVYNKAFLDGGAIPDSIEIHKNGFVLELKIPSIKPATDETCSYTWEYFNNGTWNKCGFGEEFHSIRTGGPVAFSRRTRLLRRADTVFGPAYTAECVLIDYAIPEDTSLGTHSDKQLDLGRFDTSFTTSALIDTSGPDFRDYDRFNTGGNDAFLKLEITEKMMVDIQTAALPMGVWLDVWRSDPFEVTFSGNGLNSPLLNHLPSSNIIPFPSFDDPNNPPVSLMFEPGEYELHLQGLKATNGGTTNGVIYIIIRGTTAPQITPLRP